MGSAGKRLRRSLMTTASFTVATFLYALEIFWFAGWQDVMLFLCAAVLTFLLHLGWRYQLLARFGRSG
jgi:hypothetical protein